MYIGMNNYEDYDEKWCDGHFCPRDCEICHYNAENRDADEPNDSQLEMGFNPYMGGYDYDC